MPRGSRLLCASLFHRVRRHGLPLVAQREGRSRQTRDHHRRRAGRPVRARHRPRLLCASLFHRVRRHGLPLVAQREGRSRQTRDHHRRRAGRPVRARHRHHEHRRASGLDASARRRPFRLGAYGRGAFKFVLPVAAPPLPHDRPRRRHLPHALRLRGSCGVSRPQLDGPSGKHDLPRRVRAGEPRASRRFNRGVSRAGGKRDGGRTRRWRRRRNAWRSRRCGFGSVFESVRGRRFARRRKRCWLPTSPT